MIANITLPRQMVIGGGARKELPAVLGRVGIVKPLGLTDPFMRDSGRLAALTDPFDGAVIAWSVFADPVRALLRLTQPVRRDRSGCRRPRRAARRP